MPTVETGTDPVPSASSLSLDVTYDDVPKPVLERRTAKPKEDVPKDPLQELRDRFDASSVHPLKRSRSMPSTTDKLVISHSIAVQADPEDIRREYLKSIPLGPQKDIFTADKDIVPIFTQVSSGVNWLASTIINETGLESVNTDQSITYGLALDPGAVAGLRLNYHVYGKKDPKVADSDIRSACTLALEDKYKGETITWIETAGMIQLGAGYLGSVPLSPFAMLSGGFTTSGLMRYRALQPYILGARQTPQALLKNNTINMPTVAKDAMRMIAGSEFELAGQGMLTADGSAMITYGPGFIGATAGVGASVTGEIQLAREYSVTIKSLNGSNKVQVSITDIDREAGGISARVMAGLIFPQSSLVNVFDAGQLKLLAERLGYHSLEQLITDYTTAAAFAGVKGSHQQTKLFTYEFDLSKENAACAFENLIRLSCGKAEKLANQKDSGVRLMSFGERAIAGSAYAGLSVFAQKMLLINVAQSMQKGRLDKEDGSKEFYRGRSYQQEFRNWFSNKKTIFWEVVSYRPSEEAEPQPYFHFRFDLLDYVTTQDRVNTFFRFAKTLGIREASESQRKLNDLDSLFNKIFSSTDNTHTKIDLFYTKKGINNIIESSKEFCKSAYLQSAIELNPVYAGVTLLANNRDGKEAREIMDEYINYVDRSHWYNLSRKLKIKGFQDEYRLLTGRELTIDEQLVRRATQFADAAKKLTTIREERQLIQFFTSLGQSKDFDYMESICALSKITTREETLVHELTMDGGGIFLKSIDEGKIDPPREFIAKEMAKGLAEPKSTPPKKAGVKIEDEEDVTLRF